MTADRDDSSWKYILLICFYSTVLAVFVVSRYQGTRLEADTSAFIGLIDEVVTTGRLAPNGAGYLYGFNYSVQSAALAQLGAISVKALLTLVRPFFIVIVGPAAFVVFRNFLGCNRIAGISTLLLLLQPEFLFVTLRGSHEVFTWLLVLTSLFFLMRNFSSKKIRGELAVNVCLFYFTILGLVATSVFFATSLLIGLALSFGLGQVLSARLAFEEATQLNLRRLANTALSCLIITFTFIFYIYPPAQRVVLELRTVINKVAALLFSFDVARNPYTGFVNALWISPHVYLSLTLANWGTLLASGSVWLSYTYRMALQRKAIETPRLLLWLFYTAFAIQVAISILLDLAGVLSSNLQLRLFPGLTIFAVPLAGIAMSLGLRHLFFAPRYIKPMIVLLGLVFFSWLSAASVLKASAEPTLNNKWTFSTTAEQYALEWTHNRVPPGTIWASYDGRLVEFSEVLNESGKRRFRFDFYRIDRNRTRYVLLSQVDQMWAKRMQIEVPSIYDADAIYDAGDITLYHFLPRSPFEP